MEFFSFVIFIKKSYVILLSQGHFIISKHKHHYIHVETLK